MSNGLCISIGLNNFDKNHYGRDGSLIACENDANDIAEIAKNKGFTTKILLTQDATTKAVISELYSAAKSLVSGDILVLYYSGHGGQIGDVTSDEDDKLDETWCLYDRMLVDDELYSLWSNFKSGVRILVLSDSCSSGTVIKDMLMANWSISPFSTKKSKTGNIKFKSIPFVKSWEIYKKYQDNYDVVQYLSNRGEHSDIGASVLLISACQDNQQSADGVPGDIHPNSFFTKKIKEVWSNGGYTKNLREFHKEIMDKCPPTQTPNYYWVGSMDMEFESKTPFTI